MMKTERDYKVRAIHCSHQASAEEIYERLKEITAPLDRAWEKIEKAIFWVRVGGPAGRDRPGRPSTLKMGAKITKL